MKIVVLSDTHSKHDWIDVPAGDMLIHAGDISGRGSFLACKEFCEWFGKLPHPHKILIAGNHDFLAEKDPGMFESLIPESVHYLNDSGIEIEGMKIWGSPVQPEFFDWAFNRKRGSDIRKHWDLIPDDTDILVTHGPPFEILDKTQSGELVGCIDLLDKIKQVRPKLHVFGHIHEGYGWKKEDETLFVNASNLNIRYNPVNEPMIIDWNEGKPEVI